MCCPDSGRIGPERTDLPFEELYELRDVMAHHDIVVTCTASQLPIIGKGLVETALKARRPVSIS